MLDIKEYLDALEKSGKHCNFHSKAEYEIVDFIKTQFPNIEILHDSKQNRQVIFPKEIDIYLPALKIGIEYNGIYWHQSKNDEDINKKSFYKEIFMRRYKLETIRY